MNRFPKRSLSHLCTLIFTITTLTGCIYDAAGDKFYRTLWKSSEVPLGPFDASTLTLEFLCNDMVSIKTTDSTRKSGARQIYGTYHHNGTTAVLQDLEFTLNDRQITFIEAQRDGDILFLLWRVDGMMYPFTTALQRLSAYE